ncbi:hypothetical protein SAMN06297229_1886 [Pseudidiomarina planktonica]|uniref:Uncharacterized protein n=1 Tax=Pseudidiomarina planktonica TaxID=1323738 RepID=A0A1Y6G0B8_9GAMM|nr:hypothetical protein [Pseudidiomarina planktonica]RUO63948.1 hypothetical protein CWI77_09525 [Pseudidiomarina planktonica]SMQ79967.1 hypothetical protein SAMN06297229_1886 [Pseudidiomarina planktonica]
MSMQTSFNPIKDFTIIASLSSAFLYALGFLHETVYLEHFGLNTSELAPDLSTSIAFGFRYLFLNTVIAVFMVPLSLFFALLFIDSIKEYVKKWVESKEILSRFSQRLRGSCDLRKLKPYLLIASPIILVVIMFHAIHKGIELAKSLKSAELEDRIVIVESAQQIERKGQVIRIRGGLIAFWEKSSDTTYLYNISSVTHVSYAAK